MLAGLNQTTSIGTEMNLPPWVTDPALSDQDRTKRELRYRLILAAAYHNPHASIVQLSREAGFAGEHIRNCINRGQLPKKVSLAVEALVGPEIFSRAMFQYL